MEEDELKRVKEYLKIKKLQEEDVLIKIIKEKNSKNSEGNND